MAINERRLPYLSAAHRAQLVRGIRWLLPLLDKATARPCRVAGYQDRWSIFRIDQDVAWTSIVQTYDTYGYLLDRRDNDKEALKRIESRVMSAVDESSKNAAWVAIL